MICKDNLLFINKICCKMKNLILQLFEFFRFWDWYIEKLRKIYFGNFCLNVYFWKNFKEI